MISVRIGNDLPVEWKVSRCGVPEDLSGKALSLYLLDRYGRYKIEDYTVDRDTIRFVYPGKDQRHTGEYSIILVENDGCSNMSTIDVSRAFSLVSHSSNGCECGNTVHLSSDISVPSNGSSAYEIAVKHGYKGSEEEWLGSLEGKAFTWDEMTDEQKADFRKGFSLLDASSEWGYDGEFPGALDLAVANVRTSTVLLSFLNSGSRELWQFNGGEFSDVSSWSRFGGGEFSQMTEEEVQALVNEIFNMENQS